MLDDTGAAGVMIGRAALGNPRIFGGGERYTDRQLLTLQTQILLEHFDTRAVTSMMKAHLIQYANSKEARRSIGSISALDGVYLHIGSL